MDALSFDWDGLLAYAYPPQCLIQQVINKVYSSNVDLVLIAPHWPNQTWFASMRALLVEPPFRFPEHDDLITQGGGRILHHDLHSLHLCAWHLSGDASRRRAFSLPR